MTSLRNVIHPLISLSVDQGQRCQLFNAYGCATSGAGIPAWSGSIAYPGIQDFSRSWIDADGKVNAPFNDIISSYRVGGISRALLTSCTTARFTTRFLNAIRETLPDIFRAEPAEENRACHVTVGPGYIERSIRQRLTASAKGPHYTSVMEAILPLALPVLYLQFPPFSPSLSLPDASSMPRRNPDDDATPAPTGLRAQLHHLLPRHALFHVRITIHQLASVPLVHGEFGVRWRFKNTHKLKGKAKAKAPEPEQDGDGDSFGSADTNAEDPQTLGVPSHGKFASDSSVFSTNGPEDRTSTRGQTPWLPLRDHSVSWEQPLSAVVQMSIDRDTHRLLPHPFKLTVLQRVIARDPDAPQNPQLGVVELDLAEYADSFPASALSKDIVTRRYLLRDSKTNATLRLSIRVEPEGTPPPFTAPPLPNGEILAGVSTLLTTHADVYRTRPRALDLYTPVEAPTGATPPPFNIHTLPRAYGPRPTESLIDALFNPLPVREARLVSPFTRLVPAESDSPASCSSAASLRSVTPSVSDESGRGSFLAPSGHTQAPSTSPSVSGSLSPSSSEDRGHRWWNRSRDRSRSRSRVGTRVAVA
ncbi:N-terminal C2 in EEIG1 and EHBP1 proteins-domain-containing protein [Mycena vulgaris]|nr:N-terminal C2 in EEIG1 and EHBP1 proteins-domain-containing protein [Mycena vulgaris]KAJ6565644.1 N-terminal C2 in EEIG1 and EHBP1 proteins-domain-containing protein [Mycena vulgaris]